MSDMTKNVGLPNLAGLMARESVTHVRLEYWIDQEETTETVELHAEAHGVYVGTSRTMAAEQFSGDPSPNLSIKSILEHMASTTLTQVTIIEARMARSDAETISGDGETIATV